MSEMYEYGINIVTENIPFAGTDSKIFFKLCSLPDEWHTDDLEKYVKEQNGGEDPFERGKGSGFTIKVPNRITQINKIEIMLQPSMNGGWTVEGLSICGPYYVVGEIQEWTCPLYCTLQDDKKLHTFLVEQVR